MKLRHLRYFTAVVECKGYREASRRLHIAQPSISQALSDLEDELGLKLFSRNGRNARLRPEGEIFYADAVRILQQAETAIITAGIRLRAQPLSQFCALAFSIVKRLSVKKETGNWK